MMKQQLRNPGAVHPRCHGYRKETVDGLGSKVKLHLGMEGAERLAPVPSLIGRTVTSKAAA